MQVYPSAGDVVALPQSSSKPVASAAPAAPATPAAPAPAHVNPASKNTRH